MTMYYVFNTEQLAIDAELYIRAVGNMPIVGINAATGLPEPTKAKTERWATPMQRIDGKWVFQRVPAQKLADISQEHIDYFDNTYPHTIETESHEWWPQTIL